MPRTVTSRAVRSYRTLSPLPALARLGGLLSAALSVGSHPPGVTWHSALWSPDFPPYHRSDTATVQPTPERKGSDIEARRQALMAQGRGFVAGADLLTLNSSCSARLKRIAIGRQWILCCCEFENPSATAKGNTFELGMTCLRPFDDRDVINEPTGMCLRRVSGGSYPAQRGLRSCSGSRPSQPDRLGSAPLLQSKLIQAILLHPGNARRQRCGLLDRELLQQDIQHALGSRIECVFVSGLRRALHYQHAFTALLIRVVAHPFRQLGQGRTPDGLERLGQFPGQHHLPLGSQNVQQIRQALQQAMRRLIEHPGARLGCQRLDALPTAVGLGREEALEAESVRGQPCRAERSDQGAGAGYR